MPNWCYTTMIVKGPKDELRKLLSLLHQWTSKSFEKSYFGDMWLGNIVMGAGFETMDNEKGGFPCKGEIEYFGTIEKHGDKPNDYIFPLAYTSEWDTYDNLWDAVLERHAPHCKAYWFAVEPGNCLYATNDLKGFYFKGEYAVECNLKEGNSLNEMFANEENPFTEKELHTKLSKVFGDKPLDELIELANHVKLDEYEWFHIFKIEKVA